ncbi:MULTISPECIES: hypothetical protein [Sphingomonadales]|jgi:hypothetical protein|uniref:Uncharacterized protein n=2 Tax=Sphingomonadaceae TaxID=41297 RepID=A0ABU4A1C6_9SPHN|nr:MULTISPECIES: hypothetical protein [Sphingomonadales]MDV5825554.1 hypothetical protein [Sphingobium naphthae]THG37232.1 hypothetical protein E5988_16085 [Sphingomonas olei]
MNSLVLRLLVEHRMLTRELVRERCRPKPDLARIIALRAKRLKVKLAVMRHLPRSGMALKLTRQMLTEINGRSERAPRRGSRPDDRIETPRC